MNSTAISSNDVQNNPQGKNSSEFGKYAVVIWFGILSFIIIVTYFSYKCTHSRRRLSSTHRSYSTTTTTTGNNSVSPRERGVDENTLMQYPKFLYIDASLYQSGTTASGCSICLADYKGSDMIRLLPDCGHIFHLNCIDPWLRMHVTCPICRTPPRSTPLVTSLAEVVPLSDIHA